MPNSSKKLKILLCHPAGETAALQELSARLRADGFAPWLESDLIPPEADWEAEMRKAIHASHAVIVCHTAGAEIQEGRLRKTVEYAREAQKEKTGGTLLLIPLLLEEVELPRGLQSLPWERCFEPDGYEKVVSSLRLLARQVGRSVARPGEGDGGLPPGSRLPFRRNWQLTGRERQLSLIADAQANLSITGVGGVGKTSLAVEFAYRQAGRFKGIHWLDLREPSALECQIALCGRQMDLPIWPETLPEQAAATLQAWKADGPRLVILDNFREVQAAAQVLATLQHPALRLLVLSRREEFPKSCGLQALKLNILTDEEGAVFLQKQVPDLSADSFLETRQLARKLGGLPLALELAGAFLRVTGMPVEDYLHDLGEACSESSQAALLEELNIFNPTPGDRSLLAAAQLAWSQVGETAHQQVLKAAAYCLPDTPIPPVVLREALRLDDAALGRAVTRLEALGLVHDGQDGPRLHPLVALYARSLDGPAKDVLKALADKLAVLAIQANTRVEETGSQQWFLPLRPHVFSVAGHAELAAIPEAANLFWNLGYYARLAGDFQNARTAFERALQIDEAAFGPEHPSVALDVSNLGKVLHQLGNRAEAKAALEYALTINEAIYGPDHPEVASDINNLGLLLQDSGDLRGARKAFQRALQIRESAYGPDHASLVPLLNNLGSVQQYIGDLERAGNAYERALKIAEKSRGSEHPSLVKMAHNLGVVRQNLGDLEGAREAFERALRVSQASLGMDHPEAAASLNGLGGVLQYLGDLHGSRMAFQRALGILEKSLPPDDATIKSVRTRLENVEKMLKPDS